MAEKPKAPTVPKPTPEFLEKAKKAQAKVAYEGGWALGLEGGGMAPWPASEGFFRGLESIKVKKLGSPDPVPLLSTAAFAVTESGSTQPTVALAYSSFPRPELLQMKRADGGAPNTNGVPMYAFTKEDLPLEDGYLLLDGTISDKAISYGTTGPLDSIGEAGLCAYCCPCCIPRVCFAFPRALCGPLNNVLADVFTCASGVIALQVMGVDANKRTALDKDSIKAAKDESFCCACLCDRDFVTVKDGSPPPYINFRFVAPGSSGSRAAATYKELATNLDKTVRDEAGYVLEPDGEVVLTPALPQCVTEKRKQEEYAGVTSMLFTATPDRVETKYFAGPVPAQGCCGWLWGWPALPFPSTDGDEVSVPSVRFNCGAFLLKDAVAAGTNALAGSSGEIAASILGCPPFSWLPPKVQEWMTKNLEYSADVPLYGWPDGNMSKAPTKLLFDDSGYLQSSKIAPAVARGVTKVVNMTIQSSPVDNVAICMGFPVGLPPGLPSSAYLSMSAIFDAGDVSQSCYLDEFCNVPDKETGKCDKNYPPKYPILNGPYGSWGKRPEYKDVRVDPDDKDKLDKLVKLPPKFAAAIVEATAQFFAYDGVIKGSEIKMDSKLSIFKRQGPEIIVFNDLETIENRYHGVEPTSSTGKKVNFLVYSYPSKDSAKNAMPTQWAPLVSDDSGKPPDPTTNLGKWGYDGDGKTQGYLLEEKLPGDELPRPTIPPVWMTATDDPNLPFGHYSGVLNPAFANFPNYYPLGIFPIEGRYPPDVANLAADLACWSVRAAAKTVVEFAGHELAD